MNLDGFKLRADNAGNSDFRCAIVGQRQEACARMRAGQRCADYHIGRDQSWLVVRHNYRQIVDVIRGVVWRAE